MIQIILFYLSTSCLISKPFKDIISLGIEIFKSYYYEIDFIGMQRLLKVNFMRGLKS